MFKHQLFTGFSQNLAQLFKGRLYYGWMVVAVIFSANLIAFNINPTFGLFITPLEQEFGWTREMISRSITLGTITGAVLAPVLGILMDRIGIRFLMLVSGLIASLLFLMLGWVREVWQYNFLMGMIFAILHTGVGQIMASVSISRWFFRRRGRAMGVVMMGASMGAMLFIPLDAFLINQLGWRDTYLAHALGSLLLIVLPVYLFMSNLPEKLNLGAHDEFLIRSKTGGNDQKDDESQTEEMEAEREAGVEVSWTLREASRTRAFWLTLVGVMIGSFPVMGYFVHAIPHMENMGVSRTLASSVWTTFFVVGMGAKFAWGFIIERFGVRRCLVALFLFEAAGMGLLLYADTPELLFAYAILNGLGHGPYLLLLAMVWAEYFGRKSIGKIYGTVQPAIVIASSLGPWVGGYSYDLTGNYTLFFLVGIALALLAALIFILDHPPTKPVATPSGAAR